MSDHLALLTMVAEGRHGSPHDVLGAHPDDGHVVVRALRPLAASVTVVADGVRTPMTHVTDGVWEAVLDVTDVPDYRLETTYDDGSPQLADDPYRFWPTLGETDLHLINEGRHEELWRVLGAHVRHYDGDPEEIVGTSFAVWAPKALGVRVKGDFTGWDGRLHPMRQLGTSGVWELFVPGVRGGATYKYEILGADERWRDKADPMASATQVPPETASRVFESTYDWDDAAWLEKRDARSAVRSPMSVYEVHLGSWRRRPDGSTYSYAELGGMLADYCTAMGFTHVELMPVMEHPFGGSWGYQVTSYYAPTSRFGDPDGFRALVDTLHQRDIGVILDWVPGHFPKDEFALARFDGGPLYEHPDPRRGDQPDWGTHVFDFGRNEVRNFLVANALYWVEEFHADGIRVDAVASMLYLDYSREDGEWLPNQYGGREHLEAMALLQETNAVVYRHHPGIVTVAEESTSWPGVTRPTSEGGLGFGFKWNMGWMHDSLQYIERESVHRPWHAGEITFSMAYAYSENYVLPISHDEVVHGKGSLLRKMPGDRWKQLANLRAYLAFMWSHPGKQLLFMGSEFAQESEWAESRELDWWLLEHSEHASVQRLVRDLNVVYTEHPALWSADQDHDGFTWLDGDAGDNLLAFVRRPDPDHSAAGPLVCVVNFGDAPVHDYRVGLPSAGDWAELINTDQHAYAGSGVVNGTVTGTGDAWQGQPDSAVLTVPPLGMVWLAPEPATSSGGTSARHRA
ncbi:1,4-alpha-glucan branching enzyme GlgB [Marmoricola endophyticus]|uniref:1,4-alpha-glucan branching enzyme GlgB n=2 Tax=Marmoricola endophyticus TaxID=2040280 RepID=A0A917F0G7_9ACTN|nr:1,4-alpha-glucan branching protein GlgB [Marmoricola endophyticus]GGF40008.1 1,4-alpha-glucan branching enzyme GlgB [Marmoricola endophyticus]